jgi:UDPglucose 6-dehydrogenase
VNPEFLRQGASIYDMLHPDRVVIGEHDERSGRALYTFYDEFYEGAVPIVRMNLASAEMVKYASNTFLATKISYANEVAGICERVPGVDVTEVMDGVGLDHRINRKFLNAGAGFGGSCFPKDVSALMGFAESQNVHTPLLRAVLDVNKAQPVHVARRAIEVLGSPRDKKIALLGLAFKPNTDDVREAPSLKIAQILLNEGAQVCAYDPAVVEAPIPGFGALRSTRSIGECLEGAHCCIIVTEWEQFKALKPDDFLTRMSEPIVIDARRIYDPAEFQHKLTYVAIGLHTQHDSNR